VVDHINDFKTDNRAENLQLVSQRFNSYKTQGKYSSKFKGVYFNKPSKKWIAAIYKNGKNNYLGCFEDEKDASEAYQSALLTLKQQQSCEYQYLKI
jgi:TATA-box binding protein (TBP) (component of TFIID and TFIIIB)